MDRFKQTYDRNGFVADDFVDSFNEDMIYEYLQTRFKNDVSIYVLEKEAVPPHFGRLGFLCMESEKMVISNDQVGSPSYEIKPDYFPIETMFDNFDRMESGDMSGYKYVPVANPVIPTNKLYDCDETKVIDSLMIEKGYKILDPTPGQTNMCDDSNSCPYSDDLTGKYFDRYGLHTFSDAAIEDAMIISLNFNPFNPRSAKMIQQLEWVSDYVAKGTYLYRGKTYMFQYDLKSKLYRYHSDIWMKKLGIDLSIQHHYQSFDMVCVKRFFEDMVLPRDFGLSKNYVGIMIEPFFTNRVPCLDYSIIGNWKGEVSRGVQGDSFFVPYLTPRLTIRGLGQPKGDIKHYEKNSSFFSNVIDFEVSRDEVYDKERNVRMKYYKGKIYNPDYFFKRNSEGSVLLVRDPGGPRRMYECNFRIPTQFANKGASLIEHPSTIGVIDYVIDNNRLFREQRLSGNKWGCIVDESSYGLHLQDVNNLDEEFPIEMRSQKLSIKVDPTGSSEVVNEDKGIIRRRRAIRKDVDEKVFSALRDHKYGPSYKRLDYYKKFFSRFEQDARNDSKMEDLKRLNQDNG